MDANPVQARPVEGHETARWTATVTLAAVTSTLLLVGVL
jgi:hypothetical protein